jgi:hypothetical protein
LVFLVPLPFYLGATAPFPRVFLPLWPIWLLALATLLGEALRALEKRNLPLKTPFLCGVLATLWLAALMNGRPLAKSLLFNDTLHDELLAPHYVDAGFRPDLIDAKIGELLKRNPDLKAFASFEADHYALRVHGSLSNLPEGLWLYDNPRLGKVKELPAEGMLLLVSGGRADFETLKTRFGFKGAEPLLDVGAQQLYLLRGQAEP